MPLALFFVFVVAPAVELFVLVQVAHVIGAGWTLLGLVAAALVGFLVMRRAGASWWTALRTSGAEGRLPDGRAVADAAMLFLAGLLVFLPGLISTAAGLVLLLPPARRLLGAGVAGWFVRRFTAVTGPGGTTIWTQPGQVVRGEVVRDDDPPRPPDASDPGGRPPGELPEGPRT